MMSHCDIAVARRSGWFMSPAAGQINRMSLPDRVGRYVWNTTLLQEEVRVECCGVCQRVFM